MTLNDLWVLLKQDLTQNYRVSGAKGKRTEQKSVIRRLFAPIAAVAFGLLIIWGINWLVPQFGWDILDTLLTENIGAGSSLFNVLLLFSFIGSIMFSATTVGNSSRMEYLMTMPISLRTLFLEKTIIVILYSSVFFLVIGTPIFIGLSMVSNAPLALLSIPTFVGMMLVLSTLGVSIGGLVGLFFSRILAGRRRLKQVGWFIGTSMAVLASALYYYFIFLDEGFANIFPILFEIAETLGFTSGISPGAATSALSLGFLVGEQIIINDVFLALLYGALAIILVNLNAYVSETAHYSGWLASGSTRTSKDKVIITHDVWNPQVIPGFTFNTATSVSIWYNITNIRREGRVFANYLVGPMRFVVIIVFGLFAGGELMMGFTPFIVIAIIVPFVISYAVSFAGYELVYEGRNLMNLQLAPLSMYDYVMGKVYSSAPFAFVVSAAISILVTIIAPGMLLYVPVVILSAVFINQAAGGIAANAAAIGGDFRAERIVTRQRGGAVQMPIRGWSILRAQLLPNIIGFTGLSAILGLGFFLNPLFAYGALFPFGVICLSLSRHYARSAGNKLTQKEASDYL
ncbi:MAG: hypothetical protein AM326_12540 [Candidatus Thorarchaeota archaeon SMTZ-45]|nr:MAG: hypothetical protein AM325_06100 [Candidatus Thorarchaeota archaeon SMTZ1-45]KXH77255.1 MAG: hypothetical protein AM326_12540 [Candidatus Thorarchaeota archaeon SMTZ-45]